MVSFDKNQCDFPSKEHNAVWNLGIHILPLEVSLPPAVRDSLPPYLVAGCEQMREFLLCYLRDIYDNIELYLPLPYQFSRKMLIPFMTLAILGEADEGKLTISRPVFDKFIKRLKNSIDYKDDKKAGVTMDHRISTWERSGLEVEYSAVSVTLTSEIYPNMFYAMSALANAAADEKGSMDNCFTYVDARRLNKQYKYDRYKNSLIFLNDEQRALAEILDGAAKKHKLTRSIKQGHCPGYGVSYNYKKVPVLELGCLGSFYEQKTYRGENNHKSTDMTLTMKLLHDENNHEPIADFFTALGEDSKELKRFAYRRLGRCRACYCKCPTYGGHIIKIDGKSNKVCYRFDKTAKMKCILIGTFFTLNDAPSIEKTLAHVIRHTERMLAK